MDERPDERLREGPAHAPVGRQEGRLRRHARRVRPQRGRHSGEPHRRMVPAARRTRLLAAHRRGPQMGAAHVRALGRGARPSAARTDHQAHFGKLPALALPLPQGRRQAPRDDHPARAWARSRTSSRGCARTTGSMRIPPPTSNCRASPAWSCPNRSRSTKSMPC